MLGISLGIFGISMFLWRISAFLSGIYDQQKRIADTLENLHIEQQLKDRNA